MTLPLCIDRPLRTFMKRATKRSIKPTPYLLLLALLLLLYYYQTNKISLTNPITTHTTNGTTFLTPCDRHNVNANLTHSQILNLQAALCKTRYVHVSTLCNASYHRIPPSDTTFFTTASTILVPRDAFLTAGGFDERIPTPILSTLIARLAPRLRHVQLSNPTAQSRLFTYLTHPTWAASQASTYRILKRDPLSLTLTSAPTLEQPDLTVAQQRVLHDIHHIPWTVLNRLNHSAFDPLITALDSGKSLLLVHVAHGLGNRLRALGSSLAFAKNTNRVPLLIWPVDAHCAVSFEQLFEPADFPVITDLPGYPFKDATFYDHTWTHLDSYNYMPGEGGIKDLVIVNSSKHIYYKGAYVMRTPFTSWDAANHELRKLVPVKSVRDRVDRVTERLGNSIGVHIRHLSTADDIGGVDPVGEYGDFDTRVIGYFRSACSPKVFIEELRKIIPETGLTHIFIAADSPKWRGQIAENLDNVWGMENCHGRCEIEALVDLLALARCPTVLGSFWSSFSEAVQRFSGRKIRLAGVDFGHGETGFGRDVEKYARDIVEKRRAAGK